MNKHIIFPLAVAFLFAACTKNTVGKEEWKPLDLLENGIPVIVMAPDSAVVSVTRVGVVEDVTVRKPEERYGLQIYIQPAFTNDLPALKSSQVEEVKNTVEFQKIIEEDEQGFLVALRSGDKEYYSFRLVHLQADKEYIFTTLYSEQHSLEEARRLMEAVRSGLNQ